MVRDGSLALFHAATHEPDVASALGDLDRVKEILDSDPAQISRSPTNGRVFLRSPVELTGRYRAIAAAIEARTRQWPELNAERGGALHAASRAGNRPLVELLLAHGADPNAHSDSGGNSVMQQRHRNCELFSKRTVARSIPMTSSGWMKTTK
jgi:hypothetical protein